MGDLKSEITSLLEQSAARTTAHLSIALRHIESGQEVMIDADRSVPLASVVKVPVLVEAFHRIQAGHIRLDDRWSLPGNLKTIGSGILTNLDDGLALTVRDLLTLMIIISDNTATDILYERLGIDAINRRMRDLGLQNLHVRHTIREIFDDMLPSGDPNQDREALYRWQAEHGVRRGGFAYTGGPDNNAGTPRDLARLMEIVFRAEVLDRQSCDAMLDILLKQQLNERFPRYLPAGTRCAHKTGSFAGIRNDAGILYAGDKSHVAFAILSTWDYDRVRLDHRAEVDTITAIDETMGLIGLAVYRAFAGAPN